MIVEVLSCGVADVLPEDQDNRTHFLFYPVNVLSVFEGMSHFCHLIMCFIKVETLCDAVA